MESSANSDSVTPAESTPHKKAVTRRISWRIERQYWASGLRTLVGIDEAGRGPLAGPVVAAAVTFPYEICQKFPRSLRGLTDSKQVLPAEREELFEAIQCSASAIGVGIVGSTEIDRINILQATMRAMTIAVEHVSTVLAEESMSPQLLLVDGNYFRTSLPYEFKTIVDGDAKSPHISAASIVAKVTRDRIMIQLHERYPAYNFARHKGYGTPEHREAIRKYGRCPEHRLSFGPAQEAEAAQLVFEDFLLQP